MKILVVVDMLEDFIGGRNETQKLTLLDETGKEFTKTYTVGALSTEEARRILPKIVKYVEKAKQNGYLIIFLQDTHSKNYLQTEEGKNLPVPHAIKPSRGWEIIDELKSYAHNSIVLEKPTFGSLELPNVIKKHCKEEIEEIEICGVCTGICDISNALILKASFPETPIKLQADLCACVTPESHAAALETMKMCQINVC